MHVLCLYVIIKIGESKSRILKLVSTNLNK